MEKEIEDALDTYNELCDNYKKMKKNLIDLRKNGAAFCFLYSYGEDDIQEKIDKLNEDLQLFQFFFDDLLKQAMDAREELENRASV